MFYTVNTPKCCRRDKVFYVLLDNYDEGLELESFETEEEVLAFLCKNDIEKPNWNRVQYIIVGKEIERAELVEDIRHA
jgi:hypothetical protein